MKRVVSETCSKTTDLCRSVQTFCLETAQWRRPGASSVYLLATNALFWACVFYGEQFYQFSFLCGLSVLLFVNHVLYPTSQLCVTTTKQALQLPEQYETFRQLSTTEKLVICIKFVFTLPFYAVILPIFNCLCWVAMHKFVEYTLMTTSAVAAGLLKTGEIEKACWVSYLSVLFLITVPPWRYNHITEQVTDYVESNCLWIGRSFNDSILVPCSSAALVVLQFAKYYCLGYWIPPLLKKIKQSLIRVKNFLYETVVAPIGRFLFTVKSALIYVFFGHWIPPLVNFLRRKFEQFQNYINVTIFDPVRQFYRRLKSFCIYWFCGHWIPPLVNYVKQKLNEIKNYVNVKIVQPILAKIIATKNFLVYWFGGYWIPSFKQWCSDCKVRIVDAFHKKIVDPVVDFFSNFTENMTYILLGRWIPGFLRYLRENCFEPTVDFCVRCKNAAVYCIYGYWIPDFLAYLRRKRSEFVFYLQQNYIDPFKALIYRTAIRVKNYIIETKNNIKRYIIAKAIEIRTWIIEKKVQFTNYVVETSRRLKIYLIYDVWIPFKKSCRRGWIRFKFIVKYKIVYPAIRNSALFVIYSVEWAIVNVATPLFSFLYDQSVHLCGYMWYYYGDPCWHWVSQRLPEKSPFVDDSDTELKDYLPSEDHDENASQSDEENLLEERTHTPNISRSASSSSLEEAEFSQNLDIPALDQADSDEEQERAMMPRRNLSVPKKKPTKLKTNTTKNNKLTKQRSSDKDTTDVVVRKKSSPTSPMREITDALTSAASFAMLKATVGASFVSSQMSSIMSSSGYSAEKSLEAELEADLNFSSPHHNEEAAFEADLEPDFELVDHSDVDE